MKQYITYGALLLLFSLLFTWIDPLLASFFYTLHFSKIFPLTTNFFFFYEELLHIPSLTIFCFCVCILVFNCKIVNKFILKNVLSILLSIGCIYVLVFFGLKPLWNRPRPLETHIYHQEKSFISFYKVDITSQWSQRTSTSFPSGHAATSSSLLSILPVLNRYKRRGLYKLAVGLIIPFIFIQSIFRMLLGEHFFSDIILGCGISYLVIRFINKIIFKKEIQITNES